ncbi:beta-glucosidase [Flaviramulus basaltis]|uniref:beta-glucosidase n=1 Tax=Flaviramulus basaltis TaxID=369401 RepID=A0A1K2IMK6_9FLAO|nr:glycoside hydrolase family 3 N-terminal domain-containing protein [Flaviramulus basaltis]SFZ93607.1 beta-glucosidase [Flaviramulus basaltis]
MYKRTKALMILTYLISIIAIGQNHNYQNPKALLKDRINDLLSRMTIEEKVGQMNQFVGLEHIKRNMGNMTEEDLKTNTANAFYPGISINDLEEITKKGLVSSYLHVLTIEDANYLQSLAMKSRLKIPLMFGIDAIHGNSNALDNTVYPTNIGLASSFDTKMAYTIARQTAKEMRAMNMHWTFNPNVEVARDARWGRVGETYGEDPYLVSLMGIETVKGYQQNLDSDQDVLACIKHFVGGSQPINGTNGSPTDLSERTIREVFFPPFKATVEAGAMSLMTAHNELNGIPCHSNEWLMQDVLRDEWGFKGFVVSDWMDIEHLHDLHGTATSLKDAYYQSIMAGMDLHMHGVEWNKLVTELVKEGHIPESRIDTSVYKILEIKFRLGLFEAPYADVDKTMKIRLNPEHRATALDASRNSIILLKNEDILPLKKTYQKIMVTGINANDQNILGDWSAIQKDENVITILEGLKMVAPNVEYTFVDQGWNPQKMDAKKVAEAAEVAKSSDLNIVVAGEYMMRFRWDDKTSGEDKDRSDINLVGLQNELIKKVAASGKPTILILITGRPLSIESVLDDVDVVIQAWEPGMYGGQAIAEIIYGKVNPSAKLPISIPRSSGQIQMIYNHKPSQYFHPYAINSSKPLFPFGFGLSYNNYAYSNLKLTKTEINKNENTTVSIDVTNNGNMEGIEIVQLYIRDKFSQVTRPVKELKDFARVSLKPKETKRLQFTITPDKLMFLDKKLKPIVEAGEFIVMVGSSSLDKDLLKKSIFVKKDNN